VSDLPELVLPVTDQQLQDLELSEGEGSGADLTEELHLQDLTDGGGEDVGLTEKAEEAHVPPGPHAVPRTRVATCRVSGHWLTPLIVRSIE
jgi:hypothetical protein